MNSSKHKDQNAASNNANVIRHSKRHSRHSKNKRTALKRIFKWIKRNPFKVVAILCSCILIYITVLFFLYDKGKKTYSRDRPMEIESK